jgi:hypothetical protein
VQLLHDFEWETDRVVLIQATLLHAWWYVSTSDQRDPWYWLGITITLAKGMGFNHHESYEAKDAPTRRLWRRLWWIIVYRDRLTTILTRKPLHIMDEDIHLPPLTFDDFDTKPVNTKIPILQQCDVTHNSVSKVFMADILMSKVQLLSIVGRMIDRSYTLQSFAVTTSDWKLYYRPRRRRELDLNLIHQSHSDLQQWEENLNNYCRLSYYEGEKAEGLPKTLHIFAATLNLLHLLALELLYRPLTSPTTHPSGDDERFDTTDKMVSEASTVLCRVAHDLSALMQQLREEQLLAYIPPLSVSCVTTGMASLLVDMNLSRTLAVAESEQRYHEFLRSLNVLSAIWPLAKGTASMFNRGASIKQLWFARNLRMLAEPAPAMSDEPVREDDMSDDRPPTANNGRPESSQHGSTEIPTPYRVLQSAMSGGYDNTAPAMPFTTSYGGSIYPFAFFSADFDVFDGNNGSLFFPDNLDGSVDLRRLPGYGLSGNDWTIPSGLDGADGSHPSGWT